MSTRQPYLTKPLTFSVVTPSYNQGAFLETTILSVLSQDGPFYIDYIISDNQSTDNSLEIIKKYDDLIKNRQYPIHCLSITYRWWTKNSSQTIAINKSFNMAQGSILAWINSDDYYEPGTFQIIAKQFELHPEYDLIYGHCFALYQNDSHQKLLKAEPGDYEKFLRRNHSVCQPAAFFTKKIFDQVGPIDDSLQYAFDYDLWLKILKVGRGLCIDKVLANFRIWPGSKTYREQARFQADRQKIFRSHGGNRIDPKTIYSFRQRLPFLPLLRRHTPRLYNYGKKVLYFFIDKIRYHI